MARGYSGPLSISLFLHLGIILVAIIGLPHISKPVIVMPESIAVELVTASSAPKETVTKAEIKPLEGPPQPKKALEKPSYTPMRDISVPMPPIEKVKDSEPEKKTDKPAFKKPAPPVTKPTPPQKKKVTEKPKSDFQSVLKNLAESKPVAAPAEEKEAKSVSQGSLTYSELDALRSQLGGCWNLMSGARNAQDLVVEVRLVMNPDRTVRSAKLVDNAKYNSDSFYRAAADSALRAVRNPACNPLQLPPHKYDLWKDIVIVFNPAEMF